MMIVAAVGTLLAAASPAAAQTAQSFQTDPEPRWHLAANAIFQPGGSGFRDEIEFVDFVENGTIATTYEPGDAIGFDGSVGVRLWGRIGIGAGFSTYSPERAGSIVARIPHPFHFNQHREVTGEANLARKETAFHANALYFVPAGDRFQVILGAGASFFNVEQGFVSDIEYSQAYPYDTAELRSVEVDRESESAVGFNASLDAAWKFSKSFGIGGLVRYTQATVPFTPGDRSVDVEVGGLQAGVGVRIVF